MNWLKNKDFSKISAKSLKKATSIITTVFLLAFFYVCFEIYVPIIPGSHETIIFTVQNGWSDDQIADSLQKLGTIRSTYFFKFYAIVSLKHSNLQAGEYNLSPRMSAYDIVNKMDQGDVIRDNVIILEGWDKKDIGKYLESKGICKQDYFISLVKKDYSGEFSFLEDKPKNVDLEGYLFPDTYEISKGESCEDVLSAMLANFDKKLTPDLREEIKNKKRSIFNIVTMASMIEKEVRTFDDKKIVSGILWKRLAINMPLQLDSTIIYITDNPDILVKDKAINSPYNTYKYYGLPKGPISNPGINSIIAAVYPKTTNYWYYLTDGKTIFSETLDQHNAAKAKYLSH
ncbi:MAG: endolytic transglycosylase MltG [Candidatus Staskawiczbacteria bacterium]|nr:endolytic transglycosylase MltG [Candidatus Staskawiczbacteria bacterium]